MTMGLIVVALAAAFAAQQQGPDITVKAEKPDPDQVICEKILEAGSRVSIKRRCATRGEWDAAREADRNAVDDSMRRALHQNQPPH